MQTEPEWTIRGMLIWMLLGLNCLLLLVQVSPTAHRVGRDIASFIAAGGEKAERLQKTSWRHNLGINRDPAKKWSDR